MPFVISLKTTLEKLPVTLKRIQDILSEYLFPDTVTMHIDLAEKDTRPTVWVRTDP